MHPHRRKQASTDGAPSALVLVDRGVAEHGLLVSAVASASARAFPAGTGPLRRVVRWAPARLVDEIAEGMVIEGIPFDRGGGVLAAGPVPFNTAMRWASGLDPLGVPFRPAALESPCGPWRFYSLIGASLHEAAAACAHGVQALVDAGIPVDRIEQLSPCPLPEEVLLSVSEAVGLTRAPVQGAVVRSDDGSRVLAVLARRAPSTLRRRAPRHSSGTTISPVSGSIRGISK